MFYQPLNYSEINNLAGHYAPSTNKSYNNKCEYINVIRFRNL